MDREYKGKSVSQHVSDYCVLDLETTSKYFLSAKIIEIGILKVRGDQVVSEYDVLVNPKCHIPYGATKVNHITDEMVSGAPCIQDVIDEAIAFIGDDIVIGYNNAGADMNLMYDTYMEVRGLPFRNNYIDVMHAAKRILFDVENYKLATISKHYGLDLTGEHRALKDCYLTKECYDRLYDEFGNSAFESIARSSRGSGKKPRVKYSPETRALQDLSSLVDDIIGDGEITDSELISLSSWMEDHTDLQGNAPFDRIFNALDKVFEDGVVTQEELEELKELFTDFVDPVKCRCCHDGIISVFGKHIVVTGDFDYGSREEVCALIEEAGGLNDKGVKKTTDYVVVGAKGSDAWKTGNYGSKIEKAIQWQDKGVEIKIVEECDFIPALQRAIEVGIEQVEEVEGKGCWQQQIRDMLYKLIDECELPERSLYLSDNYGQSEKTRDMIISHTVGIWEPDYPATENMKLSLNKTVMTIKQKPGHILELLLRQIQEGDLHHCLPDDAELQLQSKTDISSGTIKVQISDTSPNLAEYVKQHTVYCIRGYVSKAARFGCCSSFQECSDVKKCVHENKLYSKACMYRDSLDQGRIFYGKNRNID